MQKILNVYKPKGATPLDVIKTLKQTFPEYKDEKIGYAGRLDPLAHGVLLLMVGEETTKQREQYLNLPKEYEFEAVFGLATDTYDALGLISHNVKSLHVIKKNLDDLRLEDLPTGQAGLMTRFIKSKLGKHIQPYPPYSSKTVNGKPLFAWSRENKLSEIKIPEREIEIYEFKLLKLNTITTAKLKKEIFDQIASVAGDFRQNEIKTAWNNFFTNDKRLKTNSQFLTAKLKIACSSGTYIRSLVNELGEKLGTGAITLDILRTKVGEYSLKDTLQI